MLNFANRATAKGALPCQREGLRLTAAMILLGSLVQVKGFGFALMSSRKWWMPRKLRPRNFAPGRELQRAGNRSFIRVAIWFRQAVARNDSRSNLARIERHSRSVGLPVARPFRSRQP